MENLPTGIYPNDPRDTPDTYRVTEMDMSLVDNIEIDWNGKPDYPEFCNAFICNCDYDGREATEEEIDFINDNHLDSFYDEIYESLI